MKKRIFGRVLMLFGAICGTGWLPAFSNLVEPAAWSTLLNIFPIVGFGHADGYIVLLFYAIAVLGAVLAVQALKEDK